MPAVSGSPTQLAASVTSLANLAGLPDDAYKDGDFAYVQSTRATYQLDRTSAAAPSSVAVDTFSGNGQWVFFQASSSWETQATWYIDPAAGDDENDGATTTTALETWAEFTRRVETVSMVMTVTILSNIAEALVGHFSAANTSAVLIIQGLPTVLASGGGAGHSTLSDPVAATNTRGLVIVDNLVTAAGVPTTFAAYTGKMLRSPEISTAGPFVAPMLRASGADANVPWWCRWSSSNTKPANDSVIEVLDLVTCPTVQITTDCLPVQLRYFAFTSTGDVRSAPVVLTALAFDTAITTPSTIGTWFGCEFRGYAAASGAASQRLMGCYLNGAGVVYPGAGRLAIIGGGTTVNLLMFTPGSVAFQGFVAEGAKIQVGAAAVQSGGALTVEVGSSVCLGVFGATGHGIEVLGGGAQMRASTVFGSGNTGYGVKASAGGKVFFSGTPTITGTSGDVNLSAAPNLAATNVVPIRDGIPTAPAIAMTTWATWAAARPGGLERYAVNLADGSAITGG